MLFAGTMRTCAILVLLLFATRAHADAIGARAEPPRQDGDGFYLGVSFAFAFPTLTESGSDVRRRAAERHAREVVARLPARHPRPSNRRSGSSLDRAPRLPERTPSTTLEEVAFYGAQAKLVSRGPAAWFARLGPQRSWDEPESLDVARGPARLRGRRRPSSSATARARSAAQFMLEASRPMTWLVHDDAATQRITTSLLSLGFAGGSGF